MSVRSLQIAEFGYRLFLLPFFYLVIGPIVGLLAFLPFVADADEMMGNTVCVVALACIVVLIYWAWDKGDATKTWSRSIYKLAILVGLVAFLICVAATLFFGVVALFIAYSTGGIPAFLTGVATALARGLNAPKWSVILVSTLIGALATATWIWIRTNLEWSFELRWAYVLIGTFSGLVCAVLAERVGLLDPFGSRTSTRIGEVPSS